MTICNVLSMITVGKDTAIVVDGPQEIFYNGIGFLDENGKPHEVLSVGMDGGVDGAGMPMNSALLVAGEFSSKRIFV